MRYNNNKGLTLTRLVGVSEAGGIVVVCERDGVRFGNPFPA